MNRKLLIGGALAALLFMGSKKSTGSKTSGSVTNDEGMGDLGDLAGPNGCKPGLVPNKEDRCVHPEDANKDTVPKGGKGGSKYGLTITADCKFSFVDKTGDKFWNNWAKKVAKQWIDNGYDDPLYIAYEMLKQLSTCFAEYPLKKEFDDFVSYEYSLRDWINDHKEMWELIVLVRNRIDIDFFGGEITVEAEIKNNQLFLTYGPKFNNELFWESLKPTAYAILAMETDTPGSSYFGADKNDASTHINTVDYLFTRIFPYLKLDKSGKQIAYQYNIYDSDLYEWMAGDPIDNIEGEALNIEFP